MERATTLETRQGRRSILKNRITIGDAKIITKHRYSANNCIVKQ